MNQFKPEGVLKKQRRAVAIAIILSVLLLVMLMISLNTGLIRIDPVTVVKTIFGGGDPRDELLLFEFRLPRITIAVLVVWASLCLVLCCRVLLKTLWQIQELSDQCRRRTSCYAVRDVFFY